MARPRLSFDERIEEYVKLLNLYVQGKSPNLPFLIDLDNPMNSTSVYIDTELAKKIVTNRDIYKKHLAALRYGYVGDKKGRNGIRNIVETDGKVHDAVYNAFNNSTGRHVIKNYGLDPVNIQPVKVVAHDTSLRRLFGFYDITSQTAVLFGEEHYR